MDTPAFHPKWLVDFWLETPGINKLEPHLTSVIILVIVGAIGLNYYLKNRPAANTDYETKFQHLLQQKRVTESEITNLEEELSKGNLTKEQYEEKLSQYTTYLEKIKKDLQAFT